LGVPREELSALDFDEWCDEWLGTDVINQSLVDDPTALPPGFNLPRHLWANLNHSEPVRDNVLQILLVGARY